MIRSLLAPPLCWSCRSPAARKQLLCPGCRGALHFLPREPVTLSGIRVWAPVAYEGPARELVKALKFRGALAVAAEMAAIVVACAPDDLLRGVLVPVPLEPARRRRRGGNQAAALADAIARRTELPVADCLRRRGGGPAQVGRGRAARLTGPAGSIEARVAVPRRAPAGEAVPCRALIVDDVVTTGATLAACAAALHRAGAGEVAAVAFARTPGR